MLLLAAGVSASPAGQTEHGATDEVHERARALLADPSFQTELPGGDGEAGTGGPGQVDAGRQRQRAPADPSAGRSRQRQSDGLKLPRLPGGEIVNAVFWVVLAAVLIIALSSTMREVQRGARRRLGTAGEATAHPAPEGVAQALDPVEALARSGRYTEAVHLLLNRALGHFSRHRPLDKSLTSREILAEEEIGDRRQALSVLVDTVERSWFGGYAVDREGYEQCLAANQRLVANQRLAANQRLISNQRLKADLRP